ncbi:hypothetical protein FQA39_LY16599 [Lamprigera yunnana]|nr:hypothetical protein FQA39_LY16599 [Lamprigera yunnana]
MASLSEANKIQRCRVCLTFGGDMIHLLENYKINDKDVTALELLRECASVEMPFDDSWPQYLCKLCVKRANELYLFKLQCEQSQHLLHLELTRLEIKSEPNSIKYTFKCDQCHKEFKNHNAMTKHRRLHNPDTHSCIYCPESLPSSSLLARHMEDKHSDMKSIKCSHCNKMFFKQVNLRLHLVVHSGIKRHMCEICGTSFALGRNLTAHKRLHTGLKPYVCKQCNRGFTQQAALRSHEAGHSNVKNHICSECGAAFSRAGALYNHKKRHLSVKPFQCTLCSKAFIFSSERKRHMTVHTGEKNYQCDVCGRRFNRSTNLAVHRRIHTGETPHVCITCGKRFNQAHCLKSHMVSHKMD